jgi:hypothetical protein
MIVTIPGIAEHGGYPGNAIKIEISDSCPICGVKRGTPNIVLSYDGSRRLFVDGWKNECGHIDKYETLREGLKTGESKIVDWSTPSTRELLREQTA